MKPVILVSGPTASGKSDLAIRIAQSLNGEIINIDSVQIYKHFDIGSAKIPKEQQKGIAHHLLDLKEPGDSVDAGWYIKEAKNCIEEIQSRGKTCVLCAGTTMYITLLFHGLAALPSANEEIRSKLKECSLEELCIRLSEKDPETAARIHSNDRIRIERALEVCELSGMKASELHAAHNFSGSEIKGIFLVLGWPRDKLYERINIRSRGMFDSGLMEETKGIVDSYGSDLFPMKSLGYAQALKVLNGTICIEEAIGELQKETRNFAKRQYTFWRNEALKRGWKVHPGANEDGIELRSRDDFYRTHKRVNELIVCDYSFSELLGILQVQTAKKPERNEVYYLNAAKLEAANH